MMQPRGISIRQVWPSQYMKARKVLLLHLVHLYGCLAQILIIINMSKECKENKQATQLCVCNKQTQVVVWWIHDATSWSSHIGWNNSGNFAHPIEKLNNLFLYQGFPFLQWWHHLQIEITDKTKRYAVQTYLILNRTTLSYHIAFSKASVPCENYIDVTSCRMVF